MNGSFLMTVIYAATALAEARRPAISRYRSLLLLKERKTSRSGAAGTLGGGSELCLDHPVADLPFREDVARVLGVVA